MLVVSAAGLPSERLHHREGLVSEHTSLFLLLLFNSVIAGYCTVLPAAVLLRVPANGKIRVCARNHFMLTTAKARTSDLIGRDESKAPASCRRQ